jgi:lysophospholipase L1-like esterase
MTTLLPKLRGDDSPTLQGSKASGVGLPVQASASFSEFDRKAAEGQPLSVVFFGGSLTWGANASDPQRTSYRALMADYLQKKYPKSSFTFHDAAIGGTGSALGMFRLERDVLAKNPDLVFLDFTINDNIYESTPRSLASYEILLREMISRGIPVEIVTMGDKKVAGPDFDISTLGTYHAHLKLAEAYGTGLGDTLPLLRKAGAEGAEKLNELYPFDGIHPDDAGYRLFFEAARSGYEQAVQESRTVKVPEAPVFSNTYAHRERIRLADRPLPAGWTRSKTYRTSLWFDGLSSRWMGDVILCDIKDKDSVKPLIVEFEGTFVAIFGEANQDGLGFRVVIDGKPVPYVVPKKPAADVWPCDTARFGSGNLFKFVELSEDLAPGKHTLEIHPEFPEGVKKGQLRIESLCVAGPVR